MNMNTESFSCSPNFWKLLSTCFAVDLHFLSLFFSSLFSPYVSTHSTILVTFTVSVNSEHSELCQQEQAQWGEMKTPECTTFYSRSDNPRMDLHTHKISDVFVARIWCIYGCQKPICCARIAALNISKWEVHLNWHSDIKAGTTTKTNWHQHKVMPVKAAIFSSLLEKKKDNTRNLTSETVQAFKCFFPFKDRDVIMVSLHSDYSCDWFHQRNVPF